ncbi:MULTISPECIES: tyrosine-type recombinase/integrase [unclassified Sinorhizobium]|uniref:tyrosine-type recombinase/integrase n=1 Tax=unclassified Sinorhizobium TaxID=2613772 RepID=UPI0035252951
MPASIPTDGRLVDLPARGASAAPGQDERLTRAEQLDALDAVLPFDRRDKLAEILTDDDIATLRHLVKSGAGENTLRALASDLAYIERWCQLATGSPLPWPAPEALILKFVAHHLWDPAEREKDPQHGMPDEVAEVLRAEKLLKVSGPHAPSSVRRRLANWSTLTRWRGVEGLFSSSSVRDAVRLAVRAANRPRQRKSNKAVTASVLLKLLSTCETDRLIDLRDTALLLVAFAAGGRRRSEMASLRVEQLIDEAPVRADPKDENSPLLPCLTIALGRTKRSNSDDGKSVVLIGRPVMELKAWLKRAGITTGAVFRKIDQWGNVDRRPLTPQSVNLILKSRVRRAGLDMAAFSAHGLRSGFMTESANLGIPLVETMQQSLHKSVTQAAGYYNDAERKLGRAVRVLI